MHELLIDELGRLADLRQRSGRLVLAAAADRHEDRLLAAVLWLVASGVEDDQLQRIFAGMVATHLDDQRASARLIEAALPFLVNGASAAELVQHLRLTTLQVPHADATSLFG